MIHIKHNVLFFFEFFLISFKILYSSPSISTFKTTLFNGFRISGIDIPKNKRGAIALTYIFGIGRSLAITILDEAKVDQNKKVSDWNDQDIANIRDVVGKLKIEGELRSETQLNIKRLMDIGSYRGIRHRTGLPLRGQRTKNNSRTRKGKRKTVANKKKATK